MANEATYFINEAEVTRRSGEVTGADWATGCNKVGSNSPGIGIGTDIRNLEDNGNWTVLDQHGVARTPQIGQLIGGATDVGTAGKGTEPIRMGTPAADGAGGATEIGEATLVSLAAGWTSVAGALFAGVTEVTPNVYEANGPFTTGDAYLVWVKVTDPDGQSETDTMNIVIGADTSPAGVVAAATAAIDALVHVRAEAAGNTMTISAAAAENTVESSIVRI